MSANPKLRRKWRRRWLSSIQEFADVDTQRRLWLAPPSPHFSFVEYVCTYFDDLCLSEGGYDWAVSEGLVSRDEAMAVADFHQLADTYESPGDDYDHEAILADPKWTSVVDAAKRAQASLDFLISDPHEKRFLFEP